MAEVLGRPFLDHLIRYWAKQGVKRFVLSVGYKGDVIQKYFGDSFAGCEIAYSVEATPLGTGGGLLQSLTQLNGERFLLLNGDTFFEVPLEKLYALHTSRRSDLTFSLARVPAETRYSGLEIDPDGKIIAIGLRGTTVELINGGVYLCEKSAFESCLPLRGPSSLEDEIFPSLIRRKKRLFGFEMGGRFLDIGIPEAYGSASRLLVDSPGQSSDKEA